MLASFFWNSTILSLMWCRQFYFSSSNFRTSSVRSLFARTFFNFFASCLFVIWVLFIRKEDSVLFDLRKSWTSLVLFLWKFRVSVRKNFLGRLVLFFVNKVDVLLLNSSSSGVVIAELSILKDFKSCCPYSLSSIKAFLLAIFAKELMCPSSSLILACLW